MKRTLVVVHRWLGVPLSVLFAIWFPSAIGMMYWDFPTITPRDQLAHGRALDPRAIRITPAGALAAARVLDTPQELRLNTFDGRPVYRIRRGPSDVVVFADTGAIRGRADSDLMRRIASTWAGRDAHDPHVDAVTAVDQWTVQAPLRTLRPMWKFSFTDGQQVYVAEATGEVVQHTTIASRAGAYLGPIPHWLYFTPLRQHQRWWSAVVIWSSAIATVAAALGIVIVVWTCAPVLRVPYRGQKRWHAVLGLIFGVAAVTWAFSGMLSMDPFGARPRSAPPLTLRGRLDLDAFAARSPQDALQALAPARVKQLEWTSVLGEPGYLATLDDGATRVVPMRGAPQSTFDVAKLSAALGASGAAVGLLDRYDVYYLDRRQRKPLPVIVATDRDSRTYIDPATATVVSTYGSADWSKRWLYHALHSLDLPWLYAHRPLWDILLIVCMLGGTALSVTSLILAWRVARGSNRSVAAARVAMR